MVVAKPEMAQHINQVLSAVRVELEAALIRFPMFNSSHEGFAVIQEEHDELWEEVKANRGTDKTGFAEATQVAAMACRYILDLTPEWRP